jgi:hypothetical protein
MNEFVMSTMITCFGRKLYCITVTLTLLVNMSVPNDLAQLAIASETEPMPPST